MFTGGVSAIINGFKGFVASPIPTNTEEMYRATAAIHATINRHQILKDIFSGAIPQVKYCRYLMCYLPIFEALESGIRENIHINCIREIHIPEIFREAKLKEDIDFHSTKQVCGGATDAAIKYVEHIKLLSSRQPEFLIAHAYVQYCALFFGGQIIAKAVLRCFGSKYSAEEADKGIAFFKFKEALQALGFEKIRHLGDEYKEIIDSIHFDDSGKTKLMEEALIAFEFTDAMLEQLDRGS